MLNPNRGGMPPDEPSPRELGRYYALSQVGIEMVAPMLVGIWLDYQFDWSPWAVVAGFILGSVGGIAHLVVLSNATDNPRPGKKNGK